MAEGERFVTQLGLDANELLVGLDGVAQAYQEAGGKLLKTLSAIDKVNDANERLSRTVKVLTDNGKILTFVANTNAEGFTTLTTSIETSENSIAKLNKTLKDLANTKTNEKERASDVKALEQTYKSLNKTITETIDLRKFGFADLDKQTKEEIEAKQKLIRLEQEAKSKLGSLSSSKSPFDPKVVKESADVYKALSNSIESENNKIKTSFESLSGNVTSSGKPIHMDMKAIKDSQDTYKALSASIEAENNKIKTSFSKLSGGNTTSGKPVFMDTKVISEANQKTTELHKNWIQSQQTIVSGYERIGEALSNIDFEKATNELHAQDARTSLTAAFPANRGANPAQLLQLQQSIQNASRPVASGAVSPQQFQQILQSIQQGTLNLQGMNTAAVQVANNIQQVAVAAQQTAPATQHMLLSFQSIVRILQVQLLHTFFSEFTRGLSESIGNASQLEIKISEIQTITQSAKVTSDSWIVSLRGISDAFGLDILDVAEGAYEAISNQIVDATTAMGFLSEAAEFARATISTLGQSVNLLSSILNAFNLDAIETERVAAILFKTIELGRVRAEDMADTIGATAALANQAGVSLEEFSASIAVATIQGVRFDSANTLMRNILLKLLKPTDEMKVLFREWGVESGEAAIATFGFTGVLQKFSQELEKGGIGRLAESLQELRAIQGVVTLTNGNFEENFAKALDKIGGSAAGAKAALEEYERAKQITQNSPGFKFDREQQQIKNIFTVDIGDRLLREFVRLSEATGGLGQSFQTLSDGVIAFVRSVSISMEFGLNLVNVFGRLVESVTGSSNAITVLGAVLGSLAVTAMTTILYTMIAAMFGFAGATTAATVAVGALQRAMVALGLTNPITAIFAAASIAYSVWSVTAAQHQDELRRIDAETKDEYLKNIKDVLDLRERAAAAELAILRNTTQEKFKGINQALVPITKEFNDAVAETVKGVDELAGRLEGLPTLAGIIGAKGDSADLSSKEIEEAFQKMIDKVKKDVGKSLDLVVNLELKANNQNFKDSLVGLKDVEAVDLLEEKLADLLNTARDLGQVGEDGLVKDAEGARANYSEANDVLNQIAQKKFDLFKETKKSIEDSLELSKKLTQTFEEKQFERSIEGKSDKTQSKLLAKRAREARAKGKELGDAGDFEGAREQFELADKFYDQSIDKQNALDKKKKGRGRSGTKDLLDEAEATYKERLDLEEKFRKEAEEKQKSLPDTKGEVKDQRNAILEEQKRLEEEYRKGLDAQLGKQKEILDEATAYKKNLEELLAIQKNITAEIEKQTSLKAGKEKDRIGALSDFYGQAAQFAAGHSAQDVGVTGIITKEQGKIRDGLNQIPELIQQSKDIENNRTLPEKERIKQVEAKRQEIQDRIDQAHDYDVINGTDRQKRRIGDQPQANLEERLRDSTNRARSAARGSLEATGSLNKLEEDLKKIETVTIKANEAKEKEINVVGDLTLKIEKLNESIEIINQRIREENANLPKDKQQPLKEKIPVPGFASGGLIGGPTPTGPGDNQLIFARTGEFIVKEESAKRFYSQLVAMNNGYMPRGYANGGQVTNNVGDISINVPAGTPTQQTREIASQIRRGIRNGTISLT